MVRFEVTESDTATSLGSGDVPLLGTPRLVAWMEAATVESAAEVVGAGQTTVGTAMRIEHRRPTPVGGSVDVTAKLMSSPGGRRVTFAVEAIDGSRELVGTGEIDRVIVDRERFIEGTSTQ